MFKGFGLALKYPPTCLRDFKIQNEFLKSQNIYGICNIYIGYDIFALINCSF